MGVKQAAKRIAREAQFPAKFCVPWYEWPWPHGFGGYAEDALLHYRNDAYHRALIQLARESRRRGKRGPRKGSRALSGKSTLPQIMRRVENRWRDWGRA